MIELHDATGDWSRLERAGRLIGREPAVVRIIKKHQAYLLVNIGNEVGNDAVSPADFVAGYTDVVRRLAGAAFTRPW